MPTYYKRNVNPTNNNWNQADNWSTISSTSSTNAGTFPSSATLDPVIFDSNSVGVTVNVTSICTTLNTTGFVGTITLTGTLLANGNVTIGSGTTLGGASNLIMNANGTLDVASGTTIPNLNLGNTGGVSITLTRSTNVNNLLKNGAYITTVTASSSGTTLNVINGTLTSTSGTLAMAANVTLTINGVSSIGATGINFAGNFVLASSSTLTMLGTILTNSNTASYNFSNGTLVTNNQLFYVLNTSTVTVNLGSNSFYDMTLSGGIAFILQSNINITRNLNSGGLISLSGAFDITVGGNIIGGSAGLSNFTNNRKITATGSDNGSAIIGNFSWGGNGSNNYTLEIDCGSNNVLFTGTSRIIGGTSIIDYLATNSGTFTATGHTILYTSGNITINMNGSLNSFGTISNNGGVGRGITMLSDVYCNNFGITSNNDFLNGSGYFLNVTSGATSINNISGTGGLKFIGEANATFSHVANTTNSISAIIFAKTSGATLAIPNNFTYSNANGSIIYSSGTINHTSTLSLTNNTLLDTSGVNWNNLNMTVGVFTLNSPLNVTNNLTLGATGTVRFSGTAGWDCANLLCSTPNRLIVLETGNTYNTTNSVNMVGADLQRIIMSSSSSTEKAIWKLSDAATQSMVYVNGTRIDSSLGQTIWSFGGTLTETINWNLGTRPQTAAHTFIY